ncbi:UNC79 [Bugula neritina]|uniref:UNC79 n=1 Tax=Bugula neritina TaxID=10212 RepID=A0A7J7KDW3_BUGNE|nr:UNC79 [Bugula neritina]
MKCTCLHEDTFGGLLKTGIAQIIALEMSNMIQSDPKAAQRIIPWLYTQQNFPQRGLTHHAVAENVFKTKCQPLPLEDVSNISIMATSIMTGFVEYSTSSVAFMSSLFYGFILCQVWTVYCETLTFDYVGSGPGNDMDITQIIYNFWSIVSPTILNMVSHSKVLPINILVRIQSLDNWQPSKKKTVNKAILLDWIKKTQFRLAQIEIQSSRAVNFVTI